MYLLGITLSGVVSAQVPLALWTNASHPNGLDFGETMGISFGDYDGDGFIDVFACKSGELWRNVGGLDWQHAASLSSVMPATERRYGASFGDYDNDGLPDIATSPRVPVWGDDRMHLLHNVGGSSFSDVASDPSLMDVQAYGNAETVCWADVNGDGNLDLFVPAYPAWEGGPGNFFYLNEGPTGPSGAYRFTEASGPVGLDVPPGLSRPEGAQFADVDGDGDVDLYANGTLYRNVSTTGVARFEALPGTVSGIQLFDMLDEGAMFFDYDLDGDFDLMGVYSFVGVRLFENRGDGTFFEAEPGIIDFPLAGLYLGLSAEDWDNDGDIDFTTRGIFRRNMLVEQGRRRFDVVSTSIPPEDLSEATPAWGDWDRDGDLDCALGNWAGHGRLYENTTYSSSSAIPEKGYLRVKPVRDSRTIARGLETEYGAVAEVRLATGSDPYRRRKFVASSHGYLNQNEYALHFGLPSFNRVDVSVDFPGLAANGLWRVDKSVNPALGDIDPAALTDHDITVTRCGEVVVDGVVHDPIPLASPTLTTTEAPVSVSPESSFASPSVDAPVDAYVGLAFGTDAATQPLVVKEIILDAQLNAPLKCGSTERNVALWDVTNPASPVLVEGGAVRAATSTRNGRTVLPAEIVLQPGRSFRLVARVTAYSANTVAAPFAAGPLAVQGGLFFNDQNGCAGPRVANASIDATKTTVAIRFGTVPASQQLDPVESSLRLSRSGQGIPQLRWRNVGAAGYEISRCSASAGPCTPQRLAGSRAEGYDDTDVTPLPGERFWYAVKALNECAAGL